MAEEVKNVLNEEEKEEREDKLHELKMRLVTNLMEIEQLREWLVALEPKTDEEIEIYAKLYEQLYNFKRIKTEHSQMLYQKIRRDGLIMKGDETFDVEINYDESWENELNKDLAIDFVIKDIINICTNNKIEKIEMHQDSKGAQINIVYKD